MTTLRMTVIILMLLVCVGCSHHYTPLPPEVKGVWTTDDPRYRDRFLELSQAFVIVVTGPHDTPSVQLVDKVEIEPMGLDEALTIYSTDYSDGAHYQMALQFSPANGGEIRFKNQGQVWKRRGDTAR